MLFASKRPPTCVTLQIKTKVKNNVQLPLVVCCWLLHIFNNIIFPWSPMGFTFTVKATPPVSVTVTSTDGCYNVSWDHDNKEDILIYRVRVRESKDLSKVICEPKHPNKTSRLP